MNAIAWAAKLVGWRQDGNDGSNKDVRKGKFSPNADKVRKAFFEFKKTHPEVKSVDEMNALQRRMQSGSV